MSRINLYDGELPKEGFYSPSFFDYADGFAIQKRISPPLGVLGSGPFDHMWDKDGVSITYRGNSISNQLTVCLEGDEKKVAGVERIIREAETEFNKNRIQTTNANA
ncbi:hypothetical protein J4216_05515 [Candidatus Woesearchaeota archaeon]|nr:hypothetical protein [Candidatus Woesearchaeota archaeon]